MTTQQLCRTKIEENIIHVQFGEPLTLPLAQLNRDCKFKKVWDKFAGKSKEELAKIKAYYSRPEIKAKHNAKMKAYRSRPEIKAKIKAYKKDYYLKRKAEGKI